MRQGYRGVRDAFAPPTEQRYGGAAARPARTPAPAPTPVLKSPLLEDDGDNWAAVHADGIATTATAGSLVIVDTGIVAVNHVTVEGHRWIQQSDRVLFLGADPVTERWILTLNENLESLNGLETADEIVERTLDHVRSGLAVCLAYHERSELSSQVVREATALCRAENLPSTVVPGVSALDCLFSDLGVDPLRHGCQIFAGEDFLEHQRRPDPLAALILSLSEDTAWAELLQLLQAQYDADHEAIIYEPARYAVLEPVIRRGAIGSIGARDLAGFSILYIPAKEENG
jgi:hypothetical protein